MKSRIIVDVQIIQTPALERGMGQYLFSLLREFNRLANIKDLEVYALYSTNSKVNQSELNRIIKNLAGIKFVALPFVDASNSRRTKKAVEENSEIISNWCAQEELSGATFIIGSLFQNEIYAALPKQLDIRKSIIMYDVIPLQRFNEYQHKMKWEDYLTRFSLIQEADDLLCISKTTANDLQIYCSVAPEKLHVINGGPGDLNKIKEPKNRPSKNFILMPTGNDLRKNNRNAIIGFEHFLARTGSDLQLVITSYFSKQEKGTLSQLSSHVYFTDSVSNEELAWYYKNCKAMLFPSFYEGLGMPIIEAMLFNKPVVASGIETFTEISEDLPYYFNPHEPISIAETLEKALSDKDFESKLSCYERIIQEYSWQRTADEILQLAKTTLDKPLSNEKRRIAVVGPYPSGVSAIGKFISVLHPYLQDRCKVDYYFESSPIDRELRPNVLEFIANQHPIRELTDKRIKNYDQVIYHIGNSNHHTITAARALLNPGIVIAHDLNFENVYKDMLRRRMIDDNRLKAEKLLNKDSKAKFLYSIMSRQNAVITHSNYATGVIDNLLGNKVKAVHAQLAVDTPIHYRKHYNDSFTIGLAGILANIKGLAAIEEIARDERFKHDKVLIFGLNFAEKGVLERLRELPNVEIATDLTDYQFQQNLKRMSVFVNYRTAYQGEASYSTLETMRYGIPVIVRGDFGWYSELPDGAVVKVRNISEILDAVEKLKTDKEYFDSLSKRAQEATRELYSQPQYVETVISLLEKHNENGN